MSYYVYLADIHGNNIEIEREVLGEVADLKKGEREDSRQEDESRVIREASGADAIGVRHTRIGEGVINQLDSCRIIARFGGGYDNVDVQAATKRGIIVTFVPDYCTDAVAEHALTFALAKIRNLKQFEDRVEKGFWSAQEIKNEMAKDVTLGIIGLGRIGGTLSKKATCVGFDVIAYDPFLEDEEFTMKNAQKKDDLANLLKTADIVSINTPLTTEEESKYPTLRMLGEREFEQMNEGIYLINVSRGEIFETDSLLSALRSGKLSGLATDVIEGEPKQDSYLEKGDNPTFDKLKELSNVTVTPHCAFNSTRSLKEVKRKGAREIKRVLEGGFPREIAWVNPQVKEQYLRKFGKE